MQANKINKQIFQHLAIQMNAALVMLATYMQLLYSLQNLQRASNNVFVPFMCQTLKNKGNVLVEWWYCSYAFVHGATDLEIIVVPMFPGAQALATAPHMCSHTVRVRKPKNRYLQIDLQTIVMCRGRSNQEST